MSVEKMTMMNVIGNIEDVDKVLKDIVQTGSVDLTPVLEQVEDNNFLFNVSDNNIDRLMDFNYIQAFEKDEVIEELQAKGKEIRQIFNISNSYNSHETSMDMTPEDILSELNGIYSEVNQSKAMLDALHKEVDFLEGFYEDSFRELREFTVPVEVMRSLEFFEFKIGILSKEDRAKLKKNYENILAILFHAGSSKNGEVFIVVYPKTVKDEMARILRSLNFMEINIPLEYNGTPTEIKEQIGRKKEMLHNKIKEQETILEGIRIKYKDRLEHLLSQQQLINMMLEVKSNVAVSKKYFYLSGWVARADVDKVKAIFTKYPKALLMFKEDTGITPPTKLRNNWFFKPFESLLQMYGTPNYNELDPTPFLSLSYLLLFGTMFGDLGQGAVLLIAGILLKKKNATFGGILSRLGVASMIFGALYGAVFGFEHLLPAILIKPFESINETLIMAIGMGIFLLLIAYIFGIINAFKRHDLEEGLFGKEGIAGVVLYVTLLAMVGGTMLNRTIIPKGLGIGIVIVCLLLIVFRLPLSHLIERKKPLHGNEQVGGYYIESVFSLVEVFLSMLSGTVSFIRVGAFALTHVGLFLAFETIGHMIGNAAGNIVVIIIGNVLILTLECLIVFIQVLRLQYYELFSRYYKGDGRLFKPVSFNEQ